MIILVPLNRIKPNPWQTRIAEPGAEYIKDLALDIVKNGLLQTPMGRLMNGEEILGQPALAPNLLEARFYLENDMAVQLAFGHNRLAAFRWLADVKDYSNLEGKWASMPVDIRDLTDEQMANLAWSENEKRRDVTPIERAKAIQKRLDDFGWTNRQAAEELGIDQSTISNILRLLSLPEILQKALQMEELTERQAMALLPLFELPVFEEGFGYWEKKNDILAAALNGEASDRLRAKVDNYINNHGQRLDKAEFKLKQLIPECGIIYCGTCEACDKRYKNRNLCFDRVCFEAKTQFVRRKYLEEASFLSGYPIINQNKGGNPSYIPDEKLEAIKVAKCPNLVLDYTMNQKLDQVPGFPHARLVCEKRNDSCSCLKGLANLRANEAHNHTEKNLEEPEESGIHYVDLDELNAKISRREDEIQQEVTQETKAGPSAKELEEAARQMRKNKTEALERRQEIQDLVEERLVQALKEDAPGIFYLIAHQATYVQSYNGGLNLENCYRKIAHSLASYPVMPSNPESLDEMIRWINDGLARLQLEPISLEKRLVEVFTEEEVCAQTEPDL